MDNQIRLPNINRGVAVVIFTEFRSPRSILDKKIVSELYANLWAIHAAMVRICGRIVPLSTKAANGIFNLPNNAANAYSEMLLEATDTTRSSSSNFGS